MKYQIILIVVVMVNGILGVCPSEENIAPCTCRYDYIYCDGNYDLDLPQMFQSMRDNSTQTQKNFNGFLLRNNNFIQRIDENVFKDFTFGEIKIYDCNNL